MWRHTMSQDLPRFASANSKRVQIKHLDDHLSEVSFVNKYFDISNPTISHQVKKGGVVFTIDSRAFLDKGYFHNRIPTQSWLNQLENIAQWPFQYYWLDKNGKTNHLVVVFKQDHKAGDFDIEQFLSDVEIEVGRENRRCRLPCTIAVQPYEVFSSAPLEQQNDVVLEQVGVYSDEEALAESDDDIVYESGLCEDQITNCRKPRNFHQEQQYSESTERCWFKYNCKFGLRCQFKHSADEKTYFRGRKKGEGNPVRKLLLCMYFERGSCRYMKKKDCDYAHGADDAWCLNCCSSGHLTDQCPN